MKKRSLVAALAMLVVSAIVLTSSTYAWFAASDSAKVEAVNAQVANANGAITLKAIHNASDNALEKVSLSAADFDKAADNLTPVSLHATEDGTVKILKAGLSGSTFKNEGTPVDTGASEADYLHYSFDVKYTNGTADAKTIEMTPTWTAGTSYTYALVLIKSSAGAVEDVLFFNNGGYSAVTQMTGDVTDENGNSIIDETEANAAGAVVTAMTLTPASSGTAMDFMTVEGTAEGATAQPVVKNVEVYVWAEGNDADCVTGVPVGTAQVNFNFNVKA